VSFNRLRMSQAGASSFSFHNSAINKTPVRNQG
jgi:hypothetical protein